MEPDRGLRPSAASAWDRLEPIVGWGEHGPTLGVAGVF
jgi:hypothetical protein